MNELLARITDALGRHRSLEGYEKIDATIVSGGGLFPGVSIEETEPWREGPEMLRVLRAYFPGSLETHSLDEH
jgi:hypothetical protein